MTAVHACLPGPDGSRIHYELTSPGAFPAGAGPFRRRRAFAAAHVVADPLSDSGTALDWEATLAYRRYLWSLGFSVAEGMDTAQRGMGLDWRAARELMGRSLAEARAEGVRDRIACGVGTDQLTHGSPATLEDVRAAYEEQCEFVEGQGGCLILMASRALAATARTPEDYARVYGSILSKAREPVILHWLGEEFDPELRGYWGHKDVEAAMRSCLDLIDEHADKIEGIKLSLLNAELEVEMRRLLPQGVRMYTGDDFNYPQLILGDEEGHSDALLGILDAIAPAASAALHALDEGDEGRYKEILDPTVPLSRHIFQAPTRLYKTGVVFLAYLNGHQDHFRVLGGMESARSVAHLSKLFVLADRAGLLLDPEAATERMRRVLAVAGFV